MKNILLLIILSSSFLSVDAQIRPKKKAPGKPIKETTLNKPVLHDLSMSKCDRYLKYYKQLIKEAITANPSSSSPLEITTKIPRARIVHNYGTLGHIVMDKRSGSIPFPPITMITTVPASGVYPVDVSAFSYLDNQNGQLSSVVLKWEAGNYSDVIQVTDVYKIGTQAYAEIKRSSGAVQSIMIFPEHQMDGCQIQVR